MTEFLSKIPIEKNLFHVGQALLSSPTTLRILSLELALSSKARCGSLQPDNTLIPVWSSVFFWLGPRCRACSTRFDSRRKEVFTKTHTASGRNQFSSYRDTQLLCSDEKLLPESCLNRRVSQLGGRLECVLSSQARRTSLLLDSSVAPL